MNRHPVSARGSQALFSATAMTSHPGNFYTPMFRRGGPRM